MLKKQLLILKKGRVEYRTDKFGNVHVILGKVSFDEAKLVENLDSFMDTVMKSKPSSAKGEYIKSAYVSSTMGPGVKVSFDK